MTILAWRVVEQRFTIPPYDAFDGEGARLFGGRWNSAGQAVVYTSGTRSLAILERLVHSKSLSSLLDCCIYPIEIDVDSIQIFDTEQLPANWNEPTQFAATQELGDAWIQQGTHPVLRVASSIVHGEHNFVLNPRHPDFAQLKIGAKQSFPIDARLLQI